MGSVGGTARARGSGLDEAFEGDGAPGDNCMEAWRMACNW
jgi:hypothetical protein